MTNKISTFNFFCLLLLILFGCSSQSYYPVQNSNVRLLTSITSSSIPVTKSVSINGKAGWQSSGITVQAGDKIEISSTGTWHTGFPHNWVGGEGQNNLLRLRDVPFGNLMSLIGRIGDSYPFLVGSRAVVHVKTDGILYFRPNERNNKLRNNRGNLLVEIKKYQGFVNITETDKITTHKDQNALFNSSVSVRSNLWAVIIGISDYKDTQIPSLRYANKDAKAFYNWVISPSGGKYAPSRVKLLLNREATTKNIKTALFEWLKQALEEDTITFFFAGHGSPESPDSSNNLYLLPYDTEYNSIATSAFPMWDIETALKRFIKAKKVVVIADACHSGGVGQSFDIARRSNRSIKVNPINSGLQNLSQIGDGVCVISASDDKQFSQEGKQWGGGHGVFTYYLLNGLKGEADYNKDSRVSLGELIPFLSQQVRRATRNAQSPTVAGKFDPALSIGR